MQNAEQGDEDHETGVFRLVPEQLHAEEGAEGPAEERNTEQLTLGDPPGSGLCLRLVRAVHQQRENVYRGIIRRNVLLHTLLPIIAKRLFRDPSPKPLIYPHDPFERICTFRSVEWPYGILSVAESTASADRSVDLR